MVMRRERNVSGCCGVVCVPRREFRTVEVAWSGIAEQQLSFCWTMCQMYKGNFSFLIYQRQFLVNSSITGKAGSSTILCSDSVKLYGSKYLTLCPMSNSQGIFQTQLFCYGI